MTITFSGYKRLFYAIPPDQAEDIVYNKLLPQCEAKGIYLSNYGNHAGTHSLFSIETYNQMKEQRQLFNIGKIQQIFEALPFIVQRSSRFNLKSYDLADRVTSILDQRMEVADGDLMIAMLAQGHTARFGKRNEPQRIYCEFQAGLSRT